MGSTVWHAKPARTPMKPRMKPEIALSHACSSKTSFADTQHDLPQLSSLTVAESQAWSCLQLEVIARTHIPLGKVAAAHAL